MKKYAIFVYGTLMKGERAAHMLADYQCLGEFVLKDYALYQVSYYPGIKEMPGEAVTGEVYIVDDACMKNMDRYEDEGTLYLRKTVWVENAREVIETFVYVYNQEVTGEIIRGKWSSRLLEKSVDGFPFEIKRVNPYHALTENEILDKLERSRKHADDGMYKDADDVVRDMRAKYGL